MMKIVKEDPPPITKYVPDLPPALVAAVMKALNKEPARRFPHAGDFGAELRLLRLSAERGSETVAGRPRGPRADDVHPVDAGGGRRGCAAPAAARCDTGDPAAHASLTPSHRHGRDADTIIVKAGKLSTWLAVAGLGLAAVAVAIALTGRGRRNGGVRPQPSTASATPRPAHGDPGARRGASRARVGGACQARVGSRGRARH